jgi:hypothetical protein
LFSYSPQDQLYMAVCLHSTFPCKLCPFRCQCPLCPSNIFPFHQSLCDLNHGHQI